VQKSKKKKRIAAGVKAPEPEKKVEKQEDVAASEAFEGATGDAGSEKAFQKRRLRRQDTLRQKRLQAAENASK